MKDYTELEKLHESARDLMEKIDESHGWDNMISLDEYLYEFYDELTDDEKYQINFLLNEFSDLHNER